MVAGDPIGADLVSGTTNGNTLPVSWPAPPPPEERQITFGSPIELTQGVKYAIVVRAPDADGYLNEALWSKKNTGGYASGSRYSSSNSGSTWVESSSQDLWFETYAGAVLKDNFTFAHEGNAGILYDTVWQAQTFTAASTYTITSVTLYLYLRTDAVPGTITVSIRATVSSPGKAQNPTPTDDQEGIKITGIDQLKKLQWEAPD